MKKIEERLNRRWMNWLEGIYTQKSAQNKNEFYQMYISDNKFRVNMTVKIVKNFFDHNSINLNDMKVGNIGYSSFDRLLRTELSSNLVTIVPDKSFVPDDAALSPDLVHYFDITKENETVNCSYDMLICTEVIEHILADDKQIFANLAKLTKPEGFLVISVPNSISLLRRLLVLFGKNNIPQKKNIIKGPFGGYGHIREYAMYEIQYFLRENFNLLFTSGINDFPSTLRIPFNRFLPTSLSDDMLFIAQKKNILK